MKSLLQELYQEHQRRSFAANTILDLITMDIAHGDSQMDLKDPKTIDEISKLRKEAASLTYEEWLDTIIISKN